MTDRLLTAEQVAGILGVSVRYAWRLGREGHLGVVKVGKYRRYPESGVLAFIERGRERPVEIPTPIRAVDHGRRRFRQERAA